MNNTRRQDVAWIKKKESSAGSPFLLLLVKKIAAWVIFCSGTVYGQAEFVPSSLISQLGEFADRSLAEPYKTELATQMTDVLAIELETELISGSVRQSLTQPYASSSLLEQSWVGESVDLETDYSVILSQLLGLYKTEYHIVQSCRENSLAIPASLEAAAQQIEELSYRVEEGFRDAIGSRNLRRLRSLHPKVTKALSEQPYAADMKASDKRNLRRYLTGLKAADMAKLLCAADDWLALLEPVWLNNLKALMERHTNADQEIIASFPSANGMIMFAGSANQIVGQENLLFLADLAGNDFYKVDGGKVFSAIPQFIVDYSGDDHFESGQRSNPSAGVGTVAVLVDFEGDDKYESSLLGQGSAVLGIGLLLDLAGDDNYRARRFGQGYGFFGVGMLFDQAGDDDYRIEALGQGLGLTEGLGKLLDGKGDDHYLAKGGIPTNYGTSGLWDAWAQGVGLGPRGFAPGGIGILIDGSGMDSYDGGSFAQGGGYHLGLGVFRDDGASADDYLGTRYNFGWAAHGGVGYFNEAGGDDHYSTRHIVASGLAWDKSIALFQDHSGDDNYMLGDFSLAAAGYQSIAQFIDYDGADVYANVMPADTDDSQPNLGIFVDAGIQPDSFINKGISRPCTMANQFSFLIKVSSKTLPLNVCDQP